MVFNFLLDPEAVKSAANHPFGIQSLCEVLKGWLVNGLVFDFETEWARQEIGKTVHAMPEGFERKRLSSLLSALVKRKRLLTIMVQDYMSPDSELEQAIGLASKYQIQLLLIGSAVSTPIPAGVEKVTLAEYPDSAIEKKRHQAATDGKIYLGGEASHVDFLDENFANGLRHAKRIDICDRLLGEKFADNYEYTMRRFFLLLDRNLCSPDSCDLVIHCGESSRNGHMAYMLKSFRTGRISMMPMTLHFYSDPSGTMHLPHDRYLWSDQFGFLIGRGMDFLDERTDRNRDVNINLKNEDMIASQLADLAGIRTNTEHIT